MISVITQQLLVAEVAGDRAIARGVNMGSDVALTGI